MSVTILNFGVKKSLSDFIGPFAFILVAMLSTAYAMGMYLYRSDAIRRRKVIKYHDRFGPTVLCLLFLVALVLNFWHEVETRGFGGEIGGVNKTSVA